MKYTQLFCLLLLIPTGCRESVDHRKTDAVKEGSVVRPKESIRCSPRTNDRDWYTSGRKAPLFAGLDGIDFKISTKSAEAQRYFNQGMMLSYGFNHAEAARSFYEAIRLDSGCAMCQWGYAYVLGPNYNGGMEEDNFQRAYAAAQKAKALMANATDKEKALIDALGSRYVQKPPTDRKPLDIAYATAMMKVYQQFPSDPDIGALYAESMMDLHPWDLYDKQTKKPRDWTPELIAVLEKLMKQHPTHTGAHHFYIHAVEASATPERALASAKLFTTLVPGSGHLVHMPSHIYINTGDYHLGTLANLNAVKIDSGYTTACHAQGVYPLAYYPHNIHFLAATATLEGDSKLAWSAAKSVQHNTAEEIMEEPAWGTLQHYYTIPYYVAVKFAMWDTILAIPTPSKTLIYPRAVLHYARGLAYLGRNDVPKSKGELASLALLAKDSSLKNITIWGINNTTDLLQIAISVLSAEIAVTGKSYDEAAGLFREAIVMEDKLNYDEPPDWFFSVRHNLGAVLLAAGKYTEAEKVYREDLRTFKENGWALNGLHVALQKQGKTGEAGKVKQRLDKAWQYADYRLPVYN